MQGFQSWLFHWLCDHEQITWPLSSSAFLCTIGKITVDSSPAACDYCRDEVSSCLFVFSGVWQSLGLLTLASVWEATQTCHRCVLRIARLCSFRRAPGRGFHKGRWGWPWLCAVFPSGGVQERAWWARLQVHHSGGYPWAAPGQGWGAPAKRRKKWRRPRLSDSHLRFPILSLRGEGGREDVGVISVLYREQEEISKAKFGWIK